MIVNLQTRLNWCSVCVELPRTGNPPHKPCIRSLTQARSDIDSPIVRKVRGHPAAAPTTAAAEDRKLHDGHPSSQSTTIYGRTTPAGRFSGKHRPFVSWWTTVHRSRKIIFVGTGILRQYSRWITVDLSAKSRSNESPHKSSDAPRQVRPRSKVEAKQICRIEGAAYRVCGVFHESPSFSTEAAH